MTVRLMGLLTGTPQARRESLDLIVVTALVVVPLFLGMAFAAGRIG